MTIILQFLNVNCQYINCYYQNPFEGLFYLVLLPAAVLIAFLYILFANVLKIGHMGIRLILTIVIFIFIILQGWFTIFISIGPIWVMVVLVLAVFIAVFGRWRRSRAPSSGGGMPGVVRYGFKKLEKGGGMTAKELEADSAIKTLQSVAADYMGATDRDEQGLLAGEYMKALEAALAAAKAVEKDVGGKSGELAADRFFKQITYVQDQVKGKKIRRAA